MHKDNPLNEDNLLKFTVSMGKLLLENGAETYRVEDTVYRILEHFYPNKCGIFATNTGLFISLNSKAEIIRIKNRTINLEKLDRLNELSRNLVDDNLSFDDAIKEIDKISNLEPYPFFIKTVGISFCCGFFVFLFDGNFIDFFNSLIIGIVLSICISLLNKVNTFPFLKTIILGFIVAFSAVLMYNVGTNLNIDVVIISCLMPLVPGVGICNAIRDILEGDFISGNARIFEALMVAIAIAIGVGAILTPWINFLGGT